MNQSLNLIRDLDFTEMVNGAESQIVAGGLTIGCLPIDGIDVGGCFPKPRPFPLPHPRPFPICEAPLRNLCGSLIQGWTIGIDQLFLDG